MNVNNLICFNNLLPLNTTTTWFKLSDSIKTSSNAVAIMGYCGFYDGNKTNINCCISSNKIDGESGGYIGLDTNGHVWVKMGQGERAILFINTTNRTSFEQVTTAPEGIQYI